MTVSMRPPMLADLDAAAERTAQVLADPAATPADRYAAAATEAACYEKWFAATQDADAVLQRDAELQPAGGVNYHEPQREAEAG